MAVPGTVIFGFRNADVHGHGHVDLAVGQLRKGRLDLLDGVSNGQIRLYSFQIKDLQLLRVRHQRVVHCRLIVVKHILLVLGDDVAQVVRPSEHRQGVARSYAPPLEIADRQHRDRSRRVEAVDRQNLRVVAHDVVAEPAGAAEPLPQLVLRGLLARFRRHVHGHPHIPRLLFDHELRRLRRRHQLRPIQPVHHARRRRVLHVRRQETPRRQAHKPLGHRNRG
mmetsp:Transcript_37572/g.120533  ORF Transcript_37572/g.120533 Transcript_37572/m.120533 type:complete len:223 (-) Transcript_37572:34-702(-)